MRAAAAVFLVLATPANAADCLLSNAIYDQAETGFALQFRPTNPEDGLTTTNAFEMVVPGTDKRVSGEIVWGNGYSRPIGFLRYDCPADPTEDEEDLCLRWSGIVYAVNGSVVDLLPDQTDPAPEQVILSNLGQDIRYSGLIEALETEVFDPPWDVFRFKSCAP